MSGVDAADLGGGQVDLGRALVGEEGLDAGLVGQVQFGVGAGDEPAVAGAFEGAHQGGADHAAMAGDVNGWYSVVVRHGTCDTQATAQ